MKVRTVLIIAPGHNIYDERVLRTVELASRKSFCYYALDRERLTIDKSGAVSLPQDVAQRLRRGVKVIALPKWRKRRFVSRFTRHLFALQVARQARQLSPDVVHVHESGSLGLLIASRVKQLNPCVRVVFDYHDWIPYEIAETCRNRQKIYNFVLPASLVLYRRLARSVDFAVCISPGHAEWTERHLGISRTVVVQNVRPARPPVKHPAGEVRRQLVFVGHVMSIRRLEFFIDVLAELRAQKVTAELAICGKVEEPEYAEAMIRYARQRGVADLLTFHGSYRGDDDLLQVIGRGSIGVMVPPEQKIDSGIVSIYSPNKFFSYMILGVPTLLDAGFTNMGNILREHGAGTMFDSVADCAAQARRIWEEDLWEGMSQGGLRAGRAMNSDIYTNVLSRLYESEDWDEQVRTDDATAPLRTAAYGRSSS